MSEPAEPTPEVAYPDIIAMSPTLPTIIMVVVAVLVIAALGWAATYRWRGRK